MTISPTTKYSLTGEQIEDLRDYVQAAMQLPSTIIGNTSPTSATAGNVGQFYLDTTNDNLYYCSAKTAQGTTPETYTYTWEAVGGSNASVFYVATGDLSSVTPSGTYINFYKEPALTTAITNQELYDAFASGPVFVQETTGTPNVFVINGWYEGGASDPSSVTDPYFMLTGYSTLVKVLFNQPSGMQVIAVINLGNFTGATSQADGKSGMVPVPTINDVNKVLQGDGTWVEKSDKFVILKYGESSSWAKFIAAYNSNAIVYCRASSNANPATGAQTRLAFMAYVNNETTPTEVEFQYVRSVSSKSSSQPVDQVFVYKLTSASGGTWTVQTRDMAPKIAAGSNASVSYSSGTYTISAVQPVITQTVGQSTTAVMSQKAVSDEMDSRIVVSDTAPDQYTYGLKGALMSIYDQTNHTDYELWQCQGEDPNSGTIKEYIWKQLYPTNGGGDSVIDFTADFPNGAPDAMRDLLDYQANVGQRGVWTQILSETSGTLMEYVCAGTRTNQYTSAREYLWIRTNQYNGNWNPPQPS